MKRENGFYWIVGWMPNNDPEVAYWRDDHWEVVGRLDSPNPDVEIGVLSDRMEPPHAA